MDAEGGPGGGADRGGGGEKRDRDNEGRLNKRGGYYSKHSLRDRA